MKSISSGPWPELKSYYIHLSCEQSVVSSTVMGHQTSKYYSTKEKDTKLVVLRPSNQ